MYKIVLASLVIIAPIYSAQRIYPVAEVLGSTRYTRYKTILDLLMDDDDDISIDNEKGLHDYVRSMPGCTIVATDSLIKEFTDALETDVNILESEQQWMKGVEEDAAQQEIKKFNNEVENIAVLHKTYQIRKPYFTLVPKLDAVRHFVTHRGLSYVDPVRTSERPDDSGDDEREGEAISHITEEDSDYPYLDCARQYGRDHSEGQQLVASLAEASSVYETFINQHTPQLKNDIADFSRAGTKLVARIMRYKFSIQNTPQYKHERAKFAAGREKKENKQPEEA